MPEEKPIDEMPEKKESMAVDHTTDSSSINSDVKSKNSPIKMFLFGILTVIVILTVAGIGYTVSSVRKLSDKPMVLSMAKLLKTPIASINGQNILYSDYIEDLQTLKKYYASQQNAPATTDEVLSDQVLSRLAVNNLISQEAVKFNVSINDTDVADARKQLVASFPTEADAVKKINDDYGWSIDTFISKIVKPIVLEQKLQKAVAESRDEATKKYEGDEVQVSHILFKVEDAKDDAKVKATAQAVLLRALKGEDFAALATQYGSDSTKEKGGDLGWFGHGAMVPEFEIVAFALKDGEVNKQLVKTQFGYHLIKTTGHRVSRNFLAYMDDQVKAADFKILISGVHNPFDALKNASAAGAVSVDTASGTVK